MTNFTIKRNDTYPPLELTLKDQVGAIDLTEAETITLYIKVGAEIREGAMEVVEAAKGEVKYEWGTEDLDTAGSFEFEVEIKWKGGRIQSVPSGGTLTLEVVADLK